MLSSDVFFKLLLFFVLFSAVCARRSRWSTVFFMLIERFHLGSFDVGFPNRRSNYTIRQRTQPMGRVYAKGRNNNGQQHRRSLSLSYPYNAPVFPVKSYRLSFSWPRLFPRGTVDEINAEGILFYDELINALIRNGIEPMVTLYHWDLPVTLAHKGGWLNRETVEHYRRYADFCFRHFGDRVKKWITINEPYIELNQGYCSRVQVFAPGFLQDHCYWTYFLGSYHLLLAHGKASRLYKSTYQPHQHGMIGISLFVAWYEPEHPHNGIEQMGAELLIASGFDLFMQPIFGPNGDFPQVIKNRVGSRLPNLTEKEKRMLSGSADFLGVNYYYTMLARELKTKRDNITQIEEEWGVEEIMKPSKTSQETYHPDEFQDVFRYIKKQYGNVTMFITENGCQDAEGEGLNDKSRIKYLRGHMKEVAKAIMNGSDIRGYFVWSLMDNFEWSFGYEQKFGLFSVDFTNTTRPRTPKKSSKWFAKVTRTNRI
ncbi:hypothetical protein QR680_001144 [Steinernema hermaphroditum]|uniref:Beta-glucosidase n=1 Tax=Steinernema hermaphroditum TaxID=289476 RepID=A0AA39GZV9_9BILA|nr:hypothetical protein QR680_001144 [Steinernema hermaphroditum]